MNEPTHTFVNIEVGVAATVTAVPGGWRVNMLDLDADEIFPVSFTFSSEDRAVAKAQKIVATT